MPLASLGYQRRDRARGDAMAAQGVRNAILGCTDLVALAREHGIVLRRVGDRHVGLCPFHGEKSGSFVIYSDGHFHCFGCQAHGSAFDFIMRVRNVGFGDALACLADRAGISLPRQADRPSRHVPTPPTLAVYEREHVLDELRELWRTRREITARAAGFPTLEAFALYVELPPLAEKETELCRRFAELTAVANGYLDE